MKAGQQNCLTLQYFLTLLLASVLKLKMAVLQPCFQAHLTLAYQSNVLCAVPTKARKRHQITLKMLFTTMWELGIKPESPGREASALNC